MATEVSILDSQTINRLYDSATAGTLHNNINALNRLLQNYKNSIQNLIAQGNLKDSEVDAIKAQVDELLIKIADLDNLRTAWLGKRAIATTFDYSHNQPDFIGDYSELTNDDFSKGSICFIITN